MNLSRRGFLAGLLSSTAVAAVAPAFVPSEPIFSGYLGVYEGVRIVEDGGLTKDMIGHIVTTMKERNIPQYADDSYVMICRPNWAHEFGLRARRSDRV